jgi:hypothetical protein
MPKFTYTSSKGVQLSNGSGFIIEDVTISPSSASVTALTTASAPATGAQEVIVVTATNTGHGVYPTDGSAIGELKHFIQANGNVVNGFKIFAAPSGSTLKTVTTNAANQFCATLVWNGSAWVDIT